VPTVLIVDDDRTTVGLLKTLLELDGFSVEAVPDSATGCKVALNIVPDAFLVDFHLADSEGTDFVRWLRAQEPFGQTPVVMASGMEREDAAVSAGANHFLIKPFDPSDLVDVLKKLLDIV
jgi:DNA-binding response OmpR family regulator